MEKGTNIKRVSLKETGLKMTNEKKVEIENKERSCLSVSLSNEILPQTKVRFITFKTSFPILDSKKIMCIWLHKSSEIPRRFGTICLTARYLRFLWRSFAIFSHKTYDCEGACEPF